MELKDQEMTARLAVLEAEQQEAKSRLEAAQRTTA
jgi:hypothetical protein